MTTLSKLLRSAAFRLSLTFLVIFAIGAGIVAVRVAGGVRGLLDEQTISAVDMETRGFLAMAHRGGPSALRALIERRARAPGQSIYALTGWDGAFIAGDIAPVDPMIMNVPGVRRFDYAPREAERGPPRQAIGRVVELREAGLRLLVGRDVEEHDRLGRVMRRAVGGSVIWIGFIGVVAGLLASFRAMRRVDAMNEAAARVTAGDLEARLPRSFAGDELDRLADSVNAMVQRIAALLRGMREVSDNVAHDLRTPLTRLRNRAEEALRAPVGEERATIEKIIEDSESLIRVFDALLTIARADAGGVNGAMEPFALSAELMNLAELYEPAAEAAGATLRVDVAPELRLVGRRELIAQAISNLIDNALKHGVRPGAAHVELSARREGERIHIVVADDGPGVPIADRARVLERFARLERARATPGSGLGLSLAAAVARAHGGVLTLSDNRPGLRATLTIPIAPAPQDKRP